MAELKPLICKRCGGALDPVTLKCSYCGTYHKFDETFEATRIIVDRPGVEVLNVAQAFDRWQLAEMPKEAIAEITHRGLCGKLAEALYPYMEFEMSDDYFTDSAIIRGRLRAVKPSYRF
jgi:hypothetical protein